MTEQDAMRVAERAEGLYHMAIMYAGDKGHNADLRFTAMRDAKIIGQILDKSKSEVQTDVERSQ